MPMPVKISDELLELARSEARETRRSATAQIEHWALLGRAVEALAAHGEMLALKRLGGALPLPGDVSREALDELLSGLFRSTERGAAAARIRAAGGALYTTDPAFPGKVVEVREDGSRVPGRFESRRFVADRTRRGKRGP